MKIKASVTTFLLAAVLSLFAVPTRVQAEDTAPKSVIHVITVAWKAGTTPAQIKAALEGAQKLPSKYKGITHVWTNAIKVQNAPGATTAKTHVIVMEFADEKALKDYDGSPAQLEWYKLYLDIREQSTTFDITN